MIAFDDAAAIVTKLATPLDSEPVPLDRAHGRILAEPVVAMIDSPPATVSTMDGYAVREADLADLPARLEVAGEIFAGCGEPARLRPGIAARIFTGAPLPPGADRVVVQEAVERSGNAALFGGPPSRGRNIRPRSSDFAAGTKLLPAGRRLGPREMVAAAGADVAAVSCVRQPRVIILSSGDELAEPGSARCRTGAIPDSVSFGIAALVAEWSGMILRRERLGDDLALMESVAGKALRDADLVVVTGGASVGEKDFAKRMFESHGLALHFSKVAIKPGKPVWLGHCGGRLVMGLPGNPTSAMVTARLLLAPLIAGMSGAGPRSAWAWRRAPLAQSLEPCGDRETFARAALEHGFVRPLTNQDSGAQGTLAAADLLVRLSPHSPALAEGCTVEVLDF